MTQYITYDQYTDLGGTLDESTFNDLEYDARAFVDWVTFSRLQNDTVIPEAVVLCMYKLINLLQAKMAASTSPDMSGSGAGGVTAGIASQANDGVSISYNVLSADKVITRTDEEMWKCANRYLQGVKNQLGRKLLYRGIYPDE